MKKTLKQVNNGWYVLQWVVYLVQKCGALGRTDREAKYEGRQWGTNFLLSPKQGSGQKMTCGRNCWNPILPNIIHKYKYRYVNTNTQIQTHKYFNFLFFLCLLVYFSFRWEESVIADIPECPTITEGSSLYHEISIILNLNDTKSNNWQKNNK